MFTGLTFDVAQPSIDTAIIIAANGTVLLGHTMGKDEPPTSTLSESRLPLAYTT